MSTLPLIDLSLFLDPNSTLESRQAVGKVVDEACKEHGFFYLKGHGISENEKKEIRDLAQSFFSLSQDEKDEISISKVDYARGYQKLGQNITQYAQDWHEAIDLYESVDANHEIIKRKLKTLSGSNPTPRNPKKFNDIVDEYVSKMKNVGAMTMRAIALGLELDEYFFEQFYSKSFWVMRLIGYPPLKTKESLDSGISCGEHCDYGCLTILNQDDTIGALQVKTKTGEWVNVDPIDDCFVINIGDMVNNWTNDLYKSTLHRVIHRGDNYRISVPFFFEPNFNAIIEPLPSILSRTGESGKYKPVMYGDHLLSKYRIILISKNDI